MDKLTLQANSVYTRHLQDMVRFPTVSTENDGATDWEPFAGFRSFLEKAYPLLHRNMQRVMIGHGSLLFHWKAEHARKKPVLFMAHQDVVPAGEERKWIYPPFSGQLAEGCVWGRGSVDCKAMLLFLMEAAEELFREGFRPCFDFYISLGHNEEVFAAKDIKGSALTAAYLQKRGVELGCLFDEGGKVAGGAAVSLGEKTATDIVLYADGTGGHAARPGKGTVLGLIGKAIVAVEENPMPYRLLPLVKAQLQADAVNYAGEKQKIFSDPEAYWPQVCASAKEDSQLDALLHTTFAVTMAKGSERSNVVPSHAEAVVNVRLLPGDTAEQVLLHLKKILPAGVNIRIGHNTPVFAPVTPFDTVEFRLLKTAIHEVYGTDTQIVPSLLTGATDSRYYGDVCSNIFRFSGRYHTPAFGDIHRENEKIPENVLPVGVAFFKTFLKKYQD